MKLFKAENGAKEFVGDLKAFDEKTVTIETEDSGEDGTATFERSNISSIRLEFVD